MHPGESKVPPSPVDLQDAVRHVISAHIIDCPLGDGLALFDSRSGEYFSLNGTAALLWRAARVPTTRGELLETLCQAKGAHADESALNQDLNSALTQFIDLGLFEAAATIAHNDPVE